MSDMDDIKMLQELTADITQYIPRSGRDYNRLVTFDVEGAEVPVFIWSSRSE